MLRKISLEIISFLIVTLFMYAAVSKLIDYNTFSTQLSKSPFISNYADQIAWTLPLIEIIVAISFLSKRLRLVSLYGSLFLMTMFAAYIYEMLKYSYYIPCSCGGILSKMSWGTHFWFNIFFLILSLAGIFIEQGKIDAPAKIAKKTKRNTLPSTPQTIIS